MRLKTNSPLDKMLNGGLEDDTITNIFGPAGSGKTNITISSALSCLKSGNKVVYIDTEGSFSLERFYQMGGGEKDLKNILLVDVHTWEEQCKCFVDLENIVNENKAGLVVVDSMSSLYRLEVDIKKFYDTNKQLATQYSILSKITRKCRIPVLVTNQVYSVGEKIEVTSRMITKYWSKTMIELKRLEKENTRLAVLRKHRSMPENTKIEFEITSSGIRETGKFSIF
ncbi:MAG: DNA repair and recombination protein RadB [Candidatus Aenigmarchaeota archaeon]|nr:DNA repair and recombination protein RadB [Candidatus Aenigmarchaeota archaeon]MDI6722100.1 DNA repair and recombination protein RadB [Candidatus Aenigmarchaeota archaeon]